MKIKLLFLLLLIGSGLTAQNVPSYVPTNGLVGWWPFTGNANDSSGNGNDGTVNGATLTTDRFGSLNSAYIFDGVNDFIQVNNSLSLQNINSITINAWYNVNAWFPVGAFNWFPLVCKSNNSSTGQYSFSARQDGYIHNLYDKAASVVNTNYTNVWTQCTVVSDQDTTRFYENGVLVGVVTNYNILSNSNLQSILIFGKDSPTISEYANGKIDDIGIWNRALSHQEIINLYNSSTSIPVIACPGAQVPFNLTTGLVGWYPFCGDAEDESQNGNNGTVNGATLTSDRFGNANSAYSFDGSTNYISVPDNNLLDLSNNYSICAWYNTLDTSQLDQTILGKGSAPNQTGYQLIVNTSTNPSYIQFGFNNGGTVNGGSVTPTSNYNLNGWHSVVGTYDGLVAKLFLDGSLVDTTQVSFLLQNSSEPLLIGKETSLLGRYFKGKIDDIGIWNRALDSSEVAQLYNTGICSQAIAGSCDTLIFNANLTGFNPITYANQVKVYPNPASDNLVIDCGSNFTGLNGYSIQITNVLGQTVYNSPITAQVTNIQLNPPTWVNGTYVVQFINPQGTVLDTKRIIIQ